MLNSKLALLIISCIGLIATGSAQEVLTTQYERAPLLLNPALTGQFDGNYRLTTGLRNQSSKVLKSNVYKAYGLSADTRFQAGKRRSIGIGIVGYQNEVNNIGTRELRLSAAFHKNISRSEDQNHRFSIGINYGIAQRRYTGVSDFPRGFDSDFFYGDLGLGAGWQSAFANNQDFYLGFALQHVNEPNVSFENILTPYALPPSFVFHLGGELAVKNNFSLLPKLSYRAHRNYKSAFSSLSLKRYCNPENAVKSFQFGLMARLENGYNTGYEMEAVSLVAQMDFDKYTVGLSYDHTTSELRQAGSLESAWEISMGYIIGQENKTMNAELLKR